MTIEVARHLASLGGANSREFDEDAQHPVIATMADQADIVAGRGDMGGTMRLGSYPARLVEGTLVAKAYGRGEVTERHRHRYEVNNAYRDALTRAGLRISGTSPDGRLVEFVELDTDLHPFFVGTQAHPELKSRPTRPHPLFFAFLGAALGFADADRLPVQLAQEPAAATPAPAGTATPDGATPGAATPDATPDATQAPGRAGLTVLP
jgi:CTP synthase